MPQKVSSRQTSCGQCRHFGKKAGKCFETVSQRGVDYPIHECDERCWKIIAPNAACGDFDAKSSLKVCEFCQQRFEPNSATQRFCSESCRTMAARRKKGKVNL